MKKYLVIMTMVAIASVVTIEAKAIGYAFLKNCHEGRSSDMIWADFKTSISSIPLCNPTTANYTPMIGLYKNIPTFGYDKMYVEVANTVINKTGKVLDVFMIGEFTTRIVHRDYWLTHTSRWITPEGIVKSCNPTLSSKYPDKQDWVIVSWHGIDLFAADCGNPVDEIVQTYKPPTPPPPAPILAPKPPDSTTKVAYGPNGAISISITNTFNPSNVVENKPITTTTATNTNPMSGDGEPLRDFSQDQAVNRTVLNRELVVDGGNTGTCNNCAARVPFGQTWLGNATATAVGTAGGILLAGAIEPNRQSVVNNGYYYTNGTYTPPPPPSGGGTRAFNTTNLDPPQTTVSGTRFNNSSLNSTIPETEGGSVRNITRGSNTRGLNTAQLGRRGR